jgi:hypothetical protein
MMDDAYQMGQSTLIADPFDCIDSLHLMPYPAQSIVRPSAKYATPDILVSRLYEFPQHQTKVQIGSCRLLDLIDVLHTMKLDQLFQRP